MLIELIAILGLAALQPATESDATRADPVECFIEHPLDTTEPAAHDVNDVRCVTDALVLTGLDWVEGAEDIRTIGVAVRVYQWQTGLQTDGVVGPITGQELGIWGDPDAPPAPVMSRGEIAAQAAIGQVGTPYAYASARPGVAFDCSGLTSWAWAQAGVTIPHQSGGQSNLTRVEGDPRAGDILWYPGHVAMYIGDGQMVHAVNRSHPVRIQDVKWPKVQRVTRPG